MTEEQAKARMALMRKIGANIPEDAVWNDSINEVWASMVNGKWKPDKKQELPRVELPKYKPLPFTEPEQYDWKKNLDALKVTPPSPGMVTRRPEHRVSEINPRLVREHGTYNGIRISPQAAAKRKKVTSTVTVSPKTIVEEPNSTNVPKPAVYPSIEGSLKNQNSSLIGGIIDKVKNSDALKDLRTVLFEGDFTLKDRFDMAKTGLYRRLGVEPDDVSDKARDTTMVITKPKQEELLALRDTTVLNEAQANASYNISRDTTFFDDNNHRWFAVPRSVNLNGLKFGHRNRGDREPFEFRDFISTYKPIVAFENHNYPTVDGSGNINEFIGYDNEGNLKLGALDKFGPGDHLTLVYYGWITGVPRDKQGNPLKGQAGKDSRRYAPLVDLRAENGKSYRGPLLLMTRKKSEISKDGNVGWNQFNNIVGGGYILQADNELRLVRGSINNILDEVEKMQRNHKGKLVKFYEIDNGSYNRGMLTKDNIMTGDDFNKYVKLAEAGHIIYIKPDNFSIQ